MENIKEDILDSISETYTKPILKLVYEASVIHRMHFADDIELCHLISVKTGGCPEDCSYCAQSNKYKTQIQITPLLSIAEIEQSAKVAKASGVKRMCLAAAYRSPNSSALKRVIEYIKVIKQHGLESCITFGSLTFEQAQKLKEAGLDYYNHNIDTSPEYYSKIITTRTFSDRIKTIKNVHQANIRVCSGGILGLGETRQDRISFIHALTNLPCDLYSIPINLLSRIKGTPLANQNQLDHLELIRTIATVRIFFPKARIRLACGREDMSELEQTACFMAGANSIFYGDKLLTTNNKAPSEDQILLKKLAG